MKIFFLLPAYNEQENIGQQIDKLRKLAENLEIDHRVVVVNDCSTDNTRNIVEALIRKGYNVEIINHDRNGGPGAAFITGFKAILEGGENRLQAAEDDLIISMDADNTHSETTIRMMVAKAAEGYELVIASVFAPGGMLIGVPFLRYLLTIACNLLYQILFPVSGIKEYTGFYRAYRAGSLRKAFGAYEAHNSRMLTAKGFGCAAELLIKLRRIPVFMTEVPMLVRYDQKGGKSKLRIFRTIAEHLRIISSNLFQRNIV